MGGAVITPRTRCRVCWAALPAPYLDLGLQPLANALRRIPEPDNEVVAPLAVTRCGQCGLSQLTVVVDPTILYAGYRFRSGASKGWYRHCDALAEACAPHDRKMLDIAANDGTCMHAFRGKGWTVLGVDPTPCSDQLPILVGFWTPDMAQQVLESHGPMDLVVAQNVLGHVDDPIVFLGAIREVLADDGQCIIEVPDSAAMLEAVAFDTIYHEHLSYWSPRALHAAAHFAGMTVTQMEPLPTIHGGSMRYYLKKGRPFTSLFTADAPTAEQASVFGLLTAERLTEVQRVLASLPADATLGAIGASAKGTVMLNALRAQGNTVWPSCIVDDAVSKQGQWVPGVGIPVVEAAKACAETWDVCWVLSWNWAEALQQRMRDVGFTGKFLVTAPTVTLA